MQTILNLLMPPMILCSTFIADPATLIDLESQYFTVERETLVPVYSVLDCEVPDTQKIVVKYTYKPNLLEFHSIEANENFNVMFTVNAGTITVTYLVIDKNIPIQNIGRILFKCIGTTRSTRVTITSGTITYNDGTVYKPKLVNKNAYKIINKPVTLIGVAK